MKNRLQRVEESQLFSPKRGVTLAAHNDLLRRADFLADRPEEQRAAQKTLFQGNYNEQTVRAVLLAEPKGAYDAKYADLPKVRKAELLRGQIDQSAEITMRLATYIENHAQALWDVPAAKVFEDLSRVAFYTADIKTQEEHYAQNQRRGFKIAFANFIGDRERLRPHRERFLQDPKKAVEELFQKTIQYIPPVEFLPIGVIIRLYNEDFQAFRQSDPEHMDSSDGTTLYYPSLPNEFQGKVVLINMGTPNNQNAEDKMAVTRKHEIKHMVFSSFHACHPNVMSSERVRRWIPQLDSVQAHRTYMQSWKESYKNIARDEAIAYASHGQVESDVVSLGLHEMSDDLVTIANCLPDQPLIVDPAADPKKIQYEDTEAIYEEYQQTARELLRSLREYQYMVKMLLTASTKPHASLLPEKVEALLQNTPFDKIGRLSHYAHIRPEAVSGLVEQEMIARTTQFALEVERFESEPDRKVSTVLKRLYALDAYYPKEALPLLQRCVELCPTSVYTQVEELFSVITLAYAKEEFTAEESEAADQLNQTLAAPESLMRMIGDAVQFTNDKRGAWLLDFVSLHATESLFVEYPNLCKKMLDSLEPIFQKDVQLFAVSRSLAENIKKKILIAQAKSQIRHA